MLISCKLDETDWGYLRCILVIFAVMLGLKVKLSKRFLILVGKVLELPHLAHFFVCCADYLSSYLGLPLGTAYKRIVVRESIVERFQKILAG